MTPAQIATAYEEVTDDEAKLLATTLDKGYCRGKDFTKLNMELVKDGRKPYERMRVMLGSAYDWFAYGN